MSGQLHVLQGPVVQRTDTFIQRKSLYPADNIVLVLFAG